MDWKKELAKLAVEKLEEGALNKYGSLKPFLEECVERFNDPAYSSVQNEYYSIKRKWEAGELKLEDFVEEVKEEVLEAGSTTKGRVISVKPWGVFVRLSNGRDGVIHVSNVKNAYVQDINRYFRAGDEVTVDILSMDVEPSGKDRIDLSTKKHFASLPDYEMQQFQPKTKADMHIEQLHEQAQAIKQAQADQAKQEIATTEEKVEPVVQPVVVAEPVQEEVVTQTQQVSGYQLPERELQEIGKWVRTQTNAPMSPEALTVFTRLAEQFSLTRLAMKLFGTDLQVDLSLLLAEKVETELAGGCL